MTFPLLTLTVFAPFIGALDIHPVRIHLESDEEVLVAVHGGFVEVSANRVTILSDVAELSHQIDEGRAQASKEQAEAALRENPDDDEAEAAVKRATIRLHVASNVR